MSDSFRSMNQQKRDFYEEEARRAGWSVRQLDRQINSMLYERVALSKKKGELLKKAEKSGNLITAEDAIKDPYVLEFLGLPEPSFGTRSRKCSHPTHG